MNLENKEEKIKIMQEKMLSNGWKPKDEENKVWGKKLNHYWCISYDFVEKRVCLYSYVNHSELAYEKNKDKAVDEVVKLGMYRDPETGKVIF